MFGRWDIVLGYDLSRGLRPLAGQDADRLRSMSQYLVGRWGEPATWPREPEKVLLGLDAFIERNLLEETDNRKSIALVFEYAQFLLPTSDLDSLAQGARRAAGAISVLGAKPAHQARERRVRAGHRQAGRAERAAGAKPARGDDRSSAAGPRRARTIRSSRHRRPRAFEAGRLHGRQLAEISNGLSLTNLHVVLAQAARTGKRLDAARFRQLKKSMIERQCQGLVEFIEPKHTLDFVVGLDAAKKRLEQDANWISEGRLESAPMGYLVCGPVGTGKSFLAECYAGSIGIPCLVLRNFRSKYVGETEGNLEQVLGVLRSLGPVVVIVDEADAALGNRQASGDSGTSARVFSMIASQMGDTRYRGQIIWMLLTSRPDLLPIDLKRQGRAKCTFRCSIRTTRPTFSRCCA